MLREGTGVVFTTVEALQMLCKLGRGPQYGGGRAPGA